MSPATLKRLRGLCSKSAYHWRCNYAWAVLVDGEQHLAATDGVVMAAMRHSAAVPTPIPGPGCKPWGTPSPLWAALDETMAGLDLDKRMVEQRRRFAEAVPPSFAERLRVPPAYTRVRGLAAVGVLHLAKDAADEHVRTIRRCKQFIAEETDQNVLVGAHACLRDLTDAGGRQAPRALVAPGVSLDARLVMRALAVFDAGTSFDIWHGAPAQPVYFLADDLSGRAVVAARSDDHGLA